MLGFSKTRRKINSEINVVPYIDVMLVLLIIFMMTTPIIQQGIEVDLPQSDSSETVDFSDYYPIIITVNQEGYFINNYDTDQATNKLELQQIVGVATGRYQAVNGDIEVFIRADKNVNYNKVVVVMNGLKGGGIPKIGLLTDIP